MRTVGRLCLLAAVASVLATGEAGAQGPIKIGFLSPLSGAIAAAGKDMYSGCELYWQETGWRVAGRKLEVTLEDNEGLPATALTKLRKLVESDRVHVVAGVILSNVAYALVPYIEQQGIPALYPINSADDLTQRRRPRWLVRTGFSAGGNMHPFGEYAAKVLGYRKVVTIGLDYAFGWETVGGFHKAFEDNGGQVIQKLWVPLNVQDYGPYLAQVKKDADAVFVVALGRWTLLFAKQYAESGLKGRVPLIAGGTYNDEHVLPQLGDESLAPLLGVPRDARQPAVPRRLREGVQPATVLLLGELLHGRADPRRGRAGHRWEGGGPAGARRRAPPGQDHRRAARARGDGRLWQPDAEYLHPQGGARGRQAPEHRDPHVPGGQPVLEVRPRGVPEAARLFAGVPAVPALLTETNLIVTSFCGSRHDPGPRRPDTLAARGAPYSSWLVTARPRMI